jgi:hypothetical protein
LWEAGGGLTNTGRATIIADKNGRPKHPIYVRGAGSLSCGEHALIPIEPGDYVIKAHQAFRGVVFTPEDKRRWKMEELKEFASRFGYLFSPEELEEIKGCWDDECRNAIILGIYDRRKFSSHEEREELIRWLDAHPDRWTIEFQNATGYRPSLWEILINPEDN